MSDAVYLTKEEALFAAWDAIQDEPGTKHRVLDRLRNEFGISHEEFSEYDSTIVSNKALKIQEDRLLENAIKFKNIHGFSGADPTGSMSDAEVIRTFDSLYELEERQRNVKRVPTESEWFLAGQAAQERIDEMEWAYKKKKEEEWNLLTKPSRELDPTERNIPPFMSETLHGALLGGSGLMHEMLFGWMDLLFEQPGEGKIAHERGFGTSWNPLTGFGAWDLAEMRFNPETGDYGFSENVLADERELEELYSIRTHFNEQMTQGGYEDKYKIDQEIRELISTIPEGIIDPRTVGGIQ